MVYLSIENLFSAAELSPITFATEVCGAENQI